MLTQPIKVILSFVLSLFAFVMYTVYKNTNRKMCMFAMFASTFGDMFMTDIFNIGLMSTYFGATFFIISHIIYALCFILSSRKKNYKYFNIGFYLGVITVTFTAIALTLMMIIKTRNVHDMYISLLLYLFFIGLNLVSQYSYAYSEKGYRLFLILGMLLFLISDFLVFLPMLNICQESMQYNDFIWFTYVPAQLLIIIFNSDFIKY